MRYFACFFCSSPSSSSSSSSLPNFSLKNLPLSLNKADVKTEAANTVNTLFAKMSIMSHLLQSRLALPLLYPLNSSSVLQNATSSSRFSSPPFPSINVSPYASSKVNIKHLSKTLSLTIPFIKSTTKIIHCLRSLHALSHHRKGGGNLKLNKRTLLEEKIGRRNLLEKREINRIHFLRPQVWRILKPGSEKNTSHLKWRY